MCQAFAVCLNKTAARVKVTTIIPPNSVRVSQAWLPGGWFASSARRVSTA
jgi:hypothetical protein